ncbi:MAG: hypothetical protein DHS20C18_52070 [Saprospiraceae bacterium]|nr:MAG: hypothetical protein DHS20C18_52070 [Saprospiraceae bacterium]
MKSILRPLILIIVLAVLANILWFYEIVERIGWPGLDWLSERHYSIYVINLLVIIAYLSPVYFAKKPAWEKLILTCIELYALGMVAYLIAKAVLYTIFGSMFTFLNLYSTLAILVLIPFLTAMSFYLVTQRQLYSVSRWVVVPLFLSMSLPIFLAGGTLQMFRGFDQGIIQYAPEAVKIGYPFFWITLLMGICSLLSLSFYQKATVKPSQPDILDDLPFQQSEEEIRKF